jgi:8-oxo-dGTP pyrophosphatase MutT (NUDIX family)
MASKHQPSQANCDGAAAAEEPPAASQPPTTEDPHPVQARDLLPLGPQPASPQIVLDRAAVPPPSDGAPPPAALAAARRAWRLGAAPAADAQLERGWAVARASGARVAPACWPFLLPAAAILARLAAATREADPRAPVPQALATGVVVLDAARRVLLIRRAAGDSRPGRWEVPGGGVDDPGDASVLAGAAREVREEAGLDLAAFVGVVDGRGREFFTTRRGLVVRRFSFVAVLGDDVAPEGEGREGWVPVTIDPREHQDWIWATKAQVAAARFEDRELLFTSEEERLDIIAVYDSLETAGS